MADLKHIPPKWADRFLEWYCNPTLIEAIQGDLYEGYEELVERHGKWRAQLWYILHVFLFMNKYTMGHKKIFSSFPFRMFRSYLKTGFRHMLKNKWSSVINILGIGLATGTCIVVYAFLFLFYQNDTFHENLDEIYVVEKIVQVENQIHFYGDSPEPLGSALAATFPQIKDFTRYTSKSAVAKAGEEVFSEWVTFADHSFLEMFSFPLKEGTKDNFSQADAIFLSAETAQKYFGGENPVGKNFELNFHKEGEKINLGFQVSGVFDKHPDNASFGFNVLIPYQRLSAFGSLSVENWQSSVHTTFVQVETSDQLSIIKGQLDPFVERYNANNQGWKLLEYHFEPLSTITQHSNEVRNSFFVNSHFVGIIMLITIAVGILLLVCFNYMNTALAKSATRLKEISLRKILGGRRKQIIFQFVCENLIICLGGLLLGIFLAEALFIEWFSGMAQMDLHFNYFEHVSHAVFFVGLLLVLVLGGSGYPALYLSRLHPVSLLKKMPNLGSKKILRKLLLGAQFTFTVITIFMVVGFMKQTEIITNKSWGYNPSSKIVIPIKEGSAYQVLKNEWSATPGIKRITGSVHQIGFFSHNISISFAGEERPVDELIVGRDYLQSMEVPLHEGRHADQKIQSDLTESVIVNTRFKELMGWEKAVGQTMVIDSANYIVIGEVQNFRQQEFFIPIQPLIMRFAPEDEFRYLTVEVDEEAAIPELISSLKKSWRTISSDLPFEYSFQDDVFNSYFRAFTQITQILTVTAFFAIFISGASILSIILLLLAQKMKEISIRKILGASIWDISLWINNHFVWPIALAMLLGSLGGYGLMHVILGQIAPESITIGILPAISAIGGISAIVTICIGSQVLRAKRINPVVFLRDE